METYNPSQVLNGTYGEVWIDGEYMAEVTSVNAKVGAKFTDIPQVKKLTKGQKLTELEMTGTLKFNHVTSTFTRKLSEAFKAGRALPSTVISNISDPDAIGGQHERVKYMGVVFSEITLADFENGKPGEKSYPFTFDDFDWLDSIEA